MMVGGRESIEQCPANAETAATEFNHEELC